MLCAGVPRLVLPTLAMEAEALGVFVAGSEGPAGMDAVRGVLGADETGAGWRIVSLSTRAAVWMTPKKLKLVVV